jgi:hypothetical protein
VELEHGPHDPVADVTGDAAATTGDDADTTGKIAWAHLREIPDHPDRLEAMEAAAETNG